MAPIGNLLRESKAWVMMSDPTLIQPGTKAGGIKFIAMKFGFADHNIHDCLKAVRDLCGRFFQTMQGVSGLPWKALGNLQRYCGQNPEQSKCKPTMKSAGEIQA
jgi:hypothetical protein